MEVESQPHGDSSLVRRFQARPKMDDFKRALRAALDSRGGPQGAETGVSHQGSSREHGFPTNGGHVLGDSSGTTSSAQASGSHDHQSGDVAIGQGSGLGHDVAMEDNHQGGGGEASLSDHYGGRVLGRADHRREDGGDRGEPMEWEPDRDPSHSDSEDSDDDQDPQHFPLPRLGQGLPAAFGRPPGYRRRVHFGPGQPPVIPFWGGGGGGRGGEDVFGGEGHRLGGKEATPLFGDAQKRVEKMQEAGGLPWQQSVFCAACSLPVM